MNSKKIDLSIVIPCFNEAKNITILLKQLKDLIHDSVRLRKVSDVPLGSYLSGGIDSSVIVKELSQISSRPVETFTVSFDEKGFDEKARRGWKP